MIRLEGLYGKRLFLWCEKLNDSSSMISSISKLATCNLWSRSGSNYCEIFSKHNCGATMLL